MRLSPRFPCSATRPFRAIIAAFVASLWTCSSQLLGQWRCADRLRSSTLGHWGSFLLRASLAFARLAQSRKAHCSSTVGPTLSSTIQHGSRQPSGLLSSLQWLLAQWWSSGSTSCGVPVAAVTCMGVVLSLPWPFSCTGSRGNRLPHISISAGLVVREHDHSCNDTCAGTFLVLLYPAQTRWNSFRWLSLGFLQFLMSTGFFELLPTSRCGVPEKNGASSQVPKK